MNREWFCRTGNKQYGPLTLEQIKRMVAAGQLPLESSVRQGETGEWIPLGECPALLPAASSSQPSTVQASVKVQSAQSPAPRPAVAKTVAPATATPAKRPSVTVAASTKPSDSSAVVPVGKVASPKPAAPKAKVVSVSDSSEAIPKGKPVETIEPTLAFAPTTAKTKPKKAQRSSGGMMLVGICGVGLLIVGVMGGMLYMKQSAPAVKPKVAANEAKQSINVKKMDASEDSATTSGEPVDATKALKSVSKWRTTMNVTSKVAGIKVVSVWSGNSQAAKNATAAPDRLFVEIAINNPASTPLVYSTWNGASGKGPNAALLADQSGKFLAAIPNAKLDSGLARSSGAVKIPTGQIVTDILVFEHPGKDFELLQLVLPYSAIGQGEAFLGFKIAKELVLAERPKEVAPEALAKTNSPGNAAPTTLANTAAGFGEPAATIAAPIAAEPAMTEAAKPEATTKEPAMKSAEPKPEPMFDPKAFDKELQQLNEKAKAEKMAAEEAAKK